VLTVDRENSVIVCGMFPHVHACGVDFVTALLTYRMAGLLLCEGLEENECITTVGLLGLTVSKNPYSFLTLIVSFLNTKKNVEIVNSLHKWGKPKVSDMFSVFNLILK
jgi:hypothetical protein